MYIYTISNGLAFKMSTCTSTCMYRVYHFRHHIYMYNHVLPDRLHGRPQIYTYSTRKKKLPAPFNGHLLKRNGKGTGNERILNRIQTGYGWISTNNKRKLNRNRLSVKQNEVLFDAYCRSVKKTDPRTAWVRLTSSSIPASTTSSPPSSFTRELGRTL